MSCLQITSKEINLKYVVHCCTMIFSCYDKFEQHNNSEMKVGTLVVSIMAVAAYPFWVKAIFCPFHGKIATVIDDCGPFVSSPVLVTH